ncbi:MAG: lactate dehydrogenase [Sedimentibacter sp.]|uniref:lactate/malate family dehydrogenase n=1 Tax=Sedimentibacter sp. TaxID=1960295 RepID=UPI0031583D3F
MIYYKLKGKYLFSLKDEYGYEKVNELPEGTEELYFLHKKDRDLSKRTFAVSDPSDLFCENEDLSLLCISGEERHVPENILKLIEQRKVKAVNTEYNEYEQSLFMESEGKKKVNLLALGDVGSTLLMGLKLLGGNAVESIGIYDRSREKIQRWEYEMNQTSFPFDYDILPQVRSIEKEELFDCHMFVFCASKGVPPVGSENVDVRMVQLEENAKLIREYAQAAANANFKGIFAVVSDPVDPLCAVVLKESRGVLAPEQIKGYGLGVMNARAMYYAKKHEKFSSYLTEGRAFGPHGNDLVIANSIVNYDDKISKELTKLAVEANLEVRKTGFKPYIAPAFSSGAISIVLTLEGKFHYSSNYLGGAFMGGKNRNIPSGLEMEKISMPDELFERIKHTYEALKQLRIKNEE